MDKFTELVMKHAELNKNDDGRSSLTKIIINYGKVLLPFIVIVFY